MPQGSVMLLNLAAANRDPCKWGPTADMLDLTRVGANEHVSFGGGAHFCLGAALARLEGQIVLPPRFVASPAWLPCTTRPPGVCAWSFAA